MDLTVTLEEYEALITLARAGATTPEKQRALETWLKYIEKRSNIVRSILWVQWQEADTPLPPNTAFPEKWPPEMRHLIQLMTRPISKLDVEVVLRQKARKPVTVLVTPDPAGVLGWTPLEDFFVQ